MYSSVDDDDAKKGIATRGRQTEKCSVSYLFHPEASRKKEASPHDLGGPPAIAGCPTVVEQRCARVELDRRLFSRLFPKPLNSCLGLIDPTAADGPRGLMDSPLISTAIY